jgi:DHA2 family metal-tetracycline-proton antiporter-like MFS transporter
MSHSTSGKADMKLFWACFIALVATSFVFGVRANTIGELQDGFNLSEQQKGNINGAGMWPFASHHLLQPDHRLHRLQDRRLLCHRLPPRLPGAHAASLRLQDFYWSTLLVAVANGTVESFINPVVATVFSKEKSKWLNILHAGWPAGLALGALFCACCRIPSSFSSRVAVPLRALLHPGDRLCAAHPAACFPRQ